ncbi:hypothetical protein RJ639_014259 [Escallonia herrerae]|uniref:Uncharacterized protein n=1 Tax=Escallonia herrerae TaxID=1293975 RepID=A0AA88VI67_9ASTE|nr:hypothetical protein RJ639_014259 [Escallonia herrerae]
MELVWTARIHRLPEILKQYDVLEMSIKMQFTSSPCLTQGMGNHRPSTNDSYHIGVTRSGLVNVGGRRCEEQT